jgi:hypothetical protein
VQAQQIWLILVCFVESNKGPTVPPLITYGELAKKMGYPDGRAGHQLGRQLGIVGTFCTLDNLPPLNCIVVEKGSRYPGYGVVLRPNEPVEKAQRAVFRQNWFEIRVPTTGTFRTVWEEHVRRSPDDDNDEDD